MERKIITKKIVLSFIVGCFASILLFVSLLGENNKANDLVTGFFKHIKAHEYESAAEFLSDRSLLNHASDEMKFEDSAFLLELTLLSHFHLLDHDRYHVELIRDDFFLPFRGKNRLSISVLFKEKEGTMFERLSSRPAPLPIKSLFTVERKNGTWKITGIHIDKGPLKETFNQLYRELTLSPNFKTTQNGFVIDRIEYDPAKIKTIDKHFYRHFLRKASRFISSS